MYPNFRLFALLISLESQLSEIVVKMLRTQRCEIQNRTVLRSSVKRSLVRIEREREKERIAFIQTIPNVQSYLL